MKPLSKGAARLRNASHKRQLDPNMVRGKFEHDVYKRLAFKNAQGRAEEVLLFDPQNEGSENANLAVESQPELRLDLKRAILTFSRKERTVLYRHMVMNQNMVTATRRRREPVVFWRTWMRETALPRLRNLLAEYQVNGKVVV